MAKIIDSATLTEEALEKLDPDTTEWVYNALDCAVTHEVFQKLSPQLDTTACKTYAFSKALQAPILEMQCRGVLIDQAAREKTIKLFEAQYEQVHSQLNRILVEGIGLPKPINPNSGPQLQYLFYTVLALPTIKKRNPRGQYLPAVNREALERLSLHYLVAEQPARHILKLRDLGKKLSFLRSQIDNDGRMRTTFNIAGTDTGRLSSSISEFGTGNNLQNVERSLRRCFIADPEYKFCNIDLEQGDSRNIGALCASIFSVSHGRDFAFKYLDACTSGDLHTEVAKMYRPDLAWNSAPDRTIADQIAYRTFSYRDLAKRLGHGTNYIGTPATMAKHSKVDKHIIVEFQKNYFDGFPCIKEWHKWTINQLYKEGQLTTPFGRRRYFFDRPSDPATHRKAVAYSPQAMTADEIDLGLLALWRELSEIHLLVQVHDSILFQYPAHLEDKIVPRALEILQNAATLDLPFNYKFSVPSEAKVGWNWADWSEENPFGLVKWKGGDDRSPPARLECGSLDER